MRKWLRNFLPSFLALAFVAGCGGPPVVTKYPKVVKVFMHHPGEYSFMFNNGGQLYTVSLLSEQTDYKLIADVPDGQDMWAVVTRNPGITPNEIEIHIHSATDVGGADYRSGKTSMSTTPLETK